MEELGDLTVGGFGPTELATPEVQKITEQVKSQLQGKVSKNFSHFKALQYRSQVVAGINYLIKVQCGEGKTDYAHLKVFEALPCYGGQVELQAYQLGHAQSDPLAVF